MNLKDLQSSAQQGMRRKKMAVLTLEDRERNYKAIRAMMEDLEIDAMIVTGDGPLKYIGGEFYNTRWVYMVFFREEAFAPAAFVAGPGREYILTLTNRNTPWYWVKDSRLNGPGAISGFLKERSCETGRIGVTMRAMSAEMYENLKHDLPGAEFRVIDHPFDLVRQCKKGNELTLLRRSPQSVDICCSQLKDIVRPGITPNEIWGEWEKVMCSMGSTGTLNQIMVGKKDISSVLPPWTCEQIPLEKGDMATCEITSSAGGYYTQKIQHFSLGNPPQIMLDMNAAVDEAVWAAADMIGPGVNAKHVLEKINEVIESRGFLSPAQFTSGPVSHMSGLEVDEGTFIPGEDHLYEEGMLFVIHPSAAVKGWTPGDYAMFGPGTMFLVTADGAESLNQFPNDFVVIDC